MSPYVAGNKAQPPPKRPVNKARALTAGAGVLAAVVAAVVIMRRRKP